MEAAGSGMSTPPQRRWRRRASLTSSRHRIPPVRQGSPPFVAGEKAIPRKGLFPAIGENGVALRGQVGEDAIAGLSGRFQEPRVEEAATRNARSFARVSRKLAEISASIDLMALFLDGKGFGDEAILHAFFPVWHRPRSQAKQHRLSGHRSRKTPPWNRPRGSGKKPPSGRDGRPIEAIRCLIPSG